MMVKLPNQSKNFRDRHHVLDVLVPGSARSADFLGRGVAQERSAEVLVRGNITRHGEEEETPPAHQWQCLRSHITVRLRAAIGQFGVSFPIRLATDLSASSISEKTPKIAWPFTLAVATLAALPPMRLRPQ
jgi:hypothetical protein